MCGGALALHSPSTRRDDIAGRVGYQPNVGGGTDTHTNVDGVDRCVAQRRHVRRPGRDPARPSKWLVDALSGTLASLGRTILQAAQKDVDWALVLPDRERDVWDES
jgi:hypothetical protein